MVPVDVAQVVVVPQLGGRGGRQRGIDAARLNLPSVQVLLWMTTNNNNGSGNSDSGNNDDNNGSGGGEEDKGGE